MAATFLDIAITPDVMDVQHEMGSDSLWQTPRSRRQADRFGDSEAGMIATRDSFYLATVSQSGWPYIQHRGGPPGTTRSCWRRWRRPTIAPALNVCFFFICRRLTGTARSTLRRATARSRWRSTARTCSNVFMTWSRRISACSSN